MTIAQADKQELLEGLERQTQTVESWKPTAGDTLMGLVIDRRRDETALGNEVDVLVIETEDDTTVAVWCSAIVLMRLIDKHDPKIGDVVGIRYLGLRVSNKSGRDYKNYCLAVRPQAKNQIKVLEITDEDVPF